MQGFKEAAMVIASAWSVASMVLLWIFLTAPAPMSVEASAGRVQNICLFFVTSVSGAGWLWFRRDLKRRRRLSIEGCGKTR